jgi:hypothetical protein
MDFASLYYFRKKVIYHTTGHFPRNAAKSQRLIPIGSDNQCVASVAALRESKMCGSVIEGTLSDIFHATPQSRND